MKQPVAIYHAFIIIQVFFDHISPNIYNVRLRTLTYNSLLYHNTTAQDLSLNPANTLKTIRHTLAGTGQLTGLTRYGNHRISGRLYQKTEILSINVKIRTD
jgi:hypothetical protein